MNYFQRIRVFVFLFVCTNLTFSVIAQDIDWNNYTRLKSEGKVPEIFTTSTQEKIESDLGKDRNDLSTEQERKFLENIHYHMDDLLRSGLVLYGDASTKYIQKVANNLLASNSKLKKELQFYAVKSNLTNAFSTDQGVIFVTLGLLAQLENEAQLAYVLSHEIAHYQEKHVEKSYSNVTKGTNASTYDEHIRQLSNYSKENELEADKVGIKLYHAAGYKKSELLSTFDVLMYSYLPFDEVEFPKDYFNTDLIYIPEKYFPEKVNQISADEEYDDDRSSHPNIRKRKDAIRDELKSFNDWGSAEFIVDKNEFLRIRKLARFEGVHRDLIDCNYPDALYSIFLLEKEDPNSEYLSVSKAKAWLGIASLMGYKAKSEVLGKEKDIEGESHALVYMLNKVSKVQLYTIAMRQIEDIYKKIPNNKEVVKIRKMMIEELADVSMFKLKDYRKINYQTALERFERNKVMDSLKAASDTLNLEEANDDEEGLSKYDKIRKKRTEETDTPMNEEDEFDVEKFHLFALSDLIGESDFESDLEAFREQIKLDKEAEDNARKMSNREKRLKAKAEYNLGLDEFILLRPFVYQDYYGDVNMKGSVEFEEVLREAILTNSERVDLNVIDLTNYQKEKITTEEYNFQALLTDYIGQKVTYEDHPMFPTDYLDLQDLKKKNHDAKILFVLGNYSKTKATNKFRLVFLVMDLTSGEVEKEIIYHVYKKPRKVLLDSYVYEALERIGKKR